MSVRENLPSRAIAVGVAAASVLRCGELLGGGPLSGVLPLVAGALFAAAGVLGVSAMVSAVRGTASASYALYGLGALIMWVEERDVPWTF